MTEIVLPQLIAHGDHTNPAYAGGAAGHSSAQDRPEAAIHGTLARFDLHQAASHQPQAFGWVKATYPNAIEYAGQKQALEGGIMVATFFGVPFALGGVGMGAATAWVNDWFSNVLGIVWVWGALALLYWIILFPLRHVWRTPRDLPIIFDRANRKVYRMARQVQPGLAGLVKPWPVKALCYEWDLLDAEHNSELISSANSAQRLHRLVFLVRKSATDPTIIDSFEIGNGLAQTEAMVAPLYEHIRRFMQENGPHLPTPHEPLDSRSDDKPSWWQACGRAGPWGDSYLMWWRAHWPMAVMHHLLVGTSLAILYWFHLHGTQWIDAMALGFAWISLSMVWGQGTGIWLMAHTGYRLRWPPAVHEAIGPTTRQGAGW